MRYIQDAHYDPPVPPSQWSFWARYRGIGTAALVDGVATLGTAFFHWSVAVAVFGIGGGLVIALWAWHQMHVREFECRKSWQKREIDLANKWHQFCVHVREDSCKILSQVLGTDEPEVYVSSYKSFASSKANRIAEYFQRLVGDPTVNCAIRLADDDDGDAVYNTVGRSVGMLEKREDFTEPIPADKGIAHALRQRGHRGVCIIDNIEQERLNGVWMETATDDFPDVKTLMVAPINGYDRGSKCMLGILYVTSQKNVFCDTHTEPVKAFADLLGMIYPIITGRAETYITRSNNG